MGRVYQTELVPRDMSNDPWTWQFLSPGHVPPSQVLETGQPVGKYLPNSVSSQPLPQSQNRIVTSSLLSVIICLGHVVYKCSSSC